MIRNLLILTCLFTMASCVIVEPEQPDPTVTDVVVYLSATSSGFDKIELELLSVKFSQEQVSEWVILSEQQQLLNLQEMAIDPVTISQEELDNEAIYNLKLDFGTENYVYNGSDRHLMRLDILEEADLIVNVDEVLVKGERLEINLEIDAVASIIHQQGTDIYFLKPKLSRK